MVLVQAHEDLFLDRQQFAVASLWSTAQNTSISTLVVVDSIQASGVQSEAIHHQVLAIGEEIFQNKFSHVIDTCTGDLGGPAYRKYDLEAWMPGRGEAGEYGN